MYVFRAHYSKESTTKVSFAVLVFLQYVASLNVEIRDRVSFQAEPLGNQRVCHCEYTKRTDKTKQQQEKKQTKPLHLSISNCLHKSTKLIQNPELKPTAWKNLKTQILAQSSSRAGLFLWFGYPSQKLSKAELNNHVFPSRTLKELLSFCLLLQESSLLLSAIFQPTVSFSFSKLHNSSPSLLAPPPP